MAKLKGTSSYLPKHSHPREFTTVLTLIFMASQTFDIVLTIRVPPLVTIVSMMNDDFGGNDNILTTKIISTINYNFNDNL